VRAVKAAVRLVEISSEVGGIFETEMSPEQIEELRPSLWTWVRSSWAWSFRLFLGWSPFTELILIRRGSGKWHTIEILSSEFFNPTRIVYGENSVNQVAIQVRLLGCEKPYLVTDQGIVKAGLAERVQNVLGEKCGGIFNECIQDNRP